MAAFVDVLVVDDEDEVAGAEVEVDDELDEDSDDGAETGDESFWVGAIVLVLSERESVR